MHRAEQAIVFDFDGVLADTEPLHWKAWAALLAPYGVALSWEDYCRLGKGRRDEYMLENLSPFAAAPLRRADLEQQIGQSKETVREWCAQQSPIDPTTVRMLKDLQNLRLGMVTSSDRETVAPLLRAAGIDSCFAACVYGDELHRHKPHPEPYLLIGERLGVETGLAFEDSEAGLASARAAGFTAIPVDSPIRLPAIVRESLAAFRGE
jgi:beta-phosphoglucomutase